MSLPSNLQYSGVKPLGYPQKMRINRFQPQGNLQQFNVNDVIRFIINTNGYWDPYSAYFQFDIDFDSMEDGNVLQLDGSAQSLIRTLVIKTGSQELERIEEYDVIANILNDMHYSVEKRATLQNQGIGFNQQGFLAKHGKQVQRQFSSLYGCSGGLTTNLETPSTRITSGGTGGFNVDFTYNASDPVVTDRLFGPGVYQNEGNANYEGQQLIIARDMGTEIDLTSQPYSTGNQLKFTFGEIGFKTMVDSQSQPLMETTRIENDMISNDYKMSPGVTTNGKREIDYSMSFGGTCFEPRYTKAYTQNVIINGKPTKKEVTRASYCIPIISGILGILIPKASYKLLPMKALKDLVIEIQLNQYAYFSSGYPAMQNDTDPLQIPYRRDTWKVSRCEIVAEIVEFGNSVNDAITQQLNTGGLVLHSCSWVKGPTFSFAPDVAPQGTFQINQGFESLRSLIVVNHPLDYQVHPFCRKQYRISQNITFFQIKVGLDYYPSLAIQGHGGNTHIDIDDPGKGNNSEFMINVDKAFGKYVDILGDQYINIANFALNDRSYDPTNVTAYKDGNGNVTNYDTANGAPHYHENAVVGKALYALDLESLSYNPGSISGLNTTQKVPYEIILKSDALNAFPRKSEMHVFQYYDFIVKFSTQGNSVMGRV